MGSILDWVGYSVDISILSTFFSQKSFTILAVWEALVSTVLDRRHSAAFGVLLSVHLSIRDRVPGTIAKSFDLSLCGELAPNCAATVINAYTYDQWELDKALRYAVPSRRPIAWIQELVRAGACLKNDTYRTSIDELILEFAKGNRAENLPLLEILLEAGAVVDEPPLHQLRADWLVPSSPTHATDIILLNWGNFTNNDIWSLVSPYSDRQQTTVTVPGILEAAQGGQEHLGSYLNARSKPHDDQDRRRVLEISLSEASGRGYADVVQTLLQFGVDPNVRMLPRSEPEFQCRRVWHPVIRAANTGQFHTLRTLLIKSSTTIVFLEDRVDEQLDLCSLRNMENSRRGQILKVLSALEISTYCRNGILLNAIGPHDCEQPGQRAPDHGFVSQLLELGLACLDCQQNFGGKTLHILVRAIKKGCDVTALDYLVQRDVEVFSGLSADITRELLEVTISRFGRERNEILQFLAKNIEGFRSCAKENVCSLLLLFFEQMRCPHEPSLVKNPWECDCEDMSTLRWFLDLGVPWEGRVLAGLIKNTDDHLMLTMIHSVTDMSTTDGFNALLWSILYGRLNLAVALIERGALVNDTRGQDGRTALQQACEIGAPLWFIRLLVDQGEDVNAPPVPYRGRTALQAACSNGAQMSCINFLIEKGADVNAAPAPYEGFTALQYAATEGLMNLAGLLLDHGACVNALSGFIDTSWNRNFRFMRALDLAAQGSKLDMAHFLVAAGARSVRPGCTGFKGAIELARDGGHFAVASLLQEHADSRPGDPMEAERMWLRANPHACMYNGKLQGASWVAFVKRAGVEDWTQVTGYMKEQVQ